MSDKSIKSIKSIKKKGIKIKLETIIEEETVNVNVKSEKTIKPILVCNGECKKCDNTNCI